MVQPTHPTSSSSTDGEERAESMSTVLQNLIDDLTEFKKNHKGQRGLDGKLQMAAKILHTLRNAEPSVIRQQFFLDALSTADIDLDVVKIPEDAQEDTKTQWTRTYIEPAPPRERKRKVSFVEDPAQIFLEYDVKSRGVRPPAPVPPRRRRFERKNGMLLDYPDGEFYWLEEATGYRLRHEVEAIEAQASAENTSPIIPPPRWNNLSKQLSVVIPGTNYCEWYDHDDHRGQDYADQVEAWERETYTYWEKYPRREGEFESQQEADARKEEKYSLRMLPKEPVTGGTSVLGKRKQETSLPPNDQGTSAEVIVSRHTKKVRAPPAKPAKRAAKPKTRTTQPAVPPRRSERIKARNAGAP